MGSTRFSRSIRRKTADATSGLAVVGTSHIKMAVIKVVGYNRFVIAKELCTSG
jgi:hypothetical protein